MFLKMPTAGTPYTLSDVIQAKIGLFRSDHVLTNFAGILKSYLQVENPALVNSGTAANYILYKLLLEIRKRPEQDEVILPAYTAPSLLLPINAAGLKPVLVDIDPSTFNLDTQKIAGAISDRTLAIMPVHMFGLPCIIEPILKLTENSDIFVLEDGASALGTTIHGKHIGTIAPFGFYSLNRGKNVSTLAGGIIVWKNSEYSEIIANLIEELPTLSFHARTTLFMKFIGLSFAVRPLTYTLMAQILAKFKYTTLHTHFDCFRYTTMQAALGINIWQRITELTQRRIENGIELQQIFSGRPGYRTAVIPADSKAAFNQFPVIVDDLNRRQLIISQLLKKGIETTTLYDHPLHHIFPDLNAAATNPFPHATYLAEHLLLIPPHAQIQSKHISIVRKVIESIE
jgi:perosamine synthetase